MTVKCGHRFQIVHVGRASKLDPTYMNNLQSPPTAHTSQTVSPKTTRHVT